MLTFILYGLIVCYLVLILLQIKRSKKFRNDLIKYNEKFLKESLFDSLNYTKKVNDYYFKSFSELQDVLQEVIKIDSDEQFKNKIESLMNNLDSIKVEIELKNISIEDQLKELNYEKK
jgi:hypothetical protein